MNAAVFMHWGFTVSGGMEADSKKWKIKGGRNDLDSVTSGKE